MSCCASVFNFGLLSQNRTFVHKEIIVGDNQNVIKNGWIERWCNQGKAWLVSEYNIGFILKRTWLVINRK